MSESKKPVPGTVERADAGRVAVLTLTREGRANAWGPDMSQALLDRLRELEADEAIRACILTGSGSRAFSSGADISAPGAHQATSAGSVLNSGILGGHPLFDFLANFSKPLVSAVNGLAIGAGFLLALHSDVVLASDNAEFAMPQVALGVIPAYGGMFRLATWVGRGRASELVLSGRRLGAASAAEYGIVSEVCAPDSLMEHAHTVAAKLGSLPPLAAAMAKESLRAAYDVAGARTTALLDQYRFGMLGLTEDCAEAHLAWRERREPEFKGL